MKDINVLLKNGVNVDKSLELLGDMTMYDETIGDFLDVVDSKLSQIKHYKEVGDMPNYAILVHSLKSDARYLGFEKLAELAYEHELKSKANDFTFVNDNYDILVAEANRIVSIVKEYINEIIPFKEEPITENKKQTIIVADDSNIIRNFARKILENDYEIMSATDGKEVIDMIELNPDKNIGALLLDLNMPNVSGFDVLEYFKENNLFNKINVSIITGDDSKDTIAKAFTYPIVDMLSKPFDEREARRIVENTLNRHNY